jgi:hypothetical protein
MFNEDRSSGWLKIRGGKLACAKRWEGYGGSGLGVLEDVCVGWKRGFSGKRMAGLAL